jgi:hypothetical protein
VDGAGYQVLDKIQRVSPFYADAMSHGTGGERIASM